MIIAIFVFYLSFFSSITGAQDDFFSDLQTELIEHNHDLIAGDLECGVLPNSKLSLICKSDKQLATFRLFDIFLTSVPNSISSCGNSLTAIFITRANLSSLGDGFGSLTNLILLSLNTNIIQFLPDSIGSLSSLREFDLTSNSLSALPNEFSSLTRLLKLDLKENHSLQANTDLFKEMNQLTELDVSNTLISGLKPINVSVFKCNNSCISSSDCVKNKSCSCDAYSSLECPDRCGLNSQQLCVDCSSLVSQQQCSGNCSWCSENKEGIDCYWCDLKTQDCSDSTRCNACSGYSTSEQCEKDLSCKWCGFDYCVRKLDNCERVCTNLSQDKCESNDDCFWCSSYETCLEWTAQCLACDRFVSFCPPGCDCTSSSDSSMVIVIICVVCCVVFILVCVCVFMYFVLKKRSSSQENEMKAFSNTDTSLRFADDGIETIETPEKNVISRYSECSIVSLFRVSQETINFAYFGSPLKLCSPVTATFEMTNACGMELVVESLFVKGFKEKHEFVFSPSSFTLGANEKRKISVELTMKCSATITPSRSFICCGVSTKQQWCSLCGIQAQSELSPLLSCDDIELKRELGRGAFGKVYLGSFKGTEVAVKMYPSLTKEDNEKEANMFSKLHSPHIVTFYGISQTLNAMIIEYCKYGSVEGLFERKEMTYLMRLLICYDCSLGMKYLHSNGIIHRDLKPDNLLIVSFSKDVNTIRAKISDFGTSRFMNQTMKMTESIGTPSYMAPEVFNNEPYGKKSDVYSFGLTVWAIYSKQTPYSELPNVQTILQKVSEGYRPQMCKDCPLNDLIERCWQTNSSERPSFEEIGELLKQQI